MMCTNIYMISVEFHVLETNEFSQFLSLGKRQESRAVWYEYSLCHDHELLYCKGRCDKAYVYGALSECCTILRGLSAEWHSYKLSEIPNKYRNSLPVLQAQTHTNYPKTGSYKILLYKYKYTGGSYLQIPTGPDSARSDTPMVEPVCKGNTV